MRKMWFFFFRSMLTVMSRNSKLSSRHIVIIYIAFKTFLINAILSCSNRRFAFATLTLCYYIWHEWPLVYNGTNFWCNYTHYIIIPPNLTSHIGIQRNREISMFANFAKFAHFEIFREMQNFDILQNTKWAKKFLAWNP